MPATFILGEHPPSSGYGATRRAMAVAALYYQDESIAGPKDDMPINGDDTTKGLNES